MCSWILVKTLWEVYSLHYFTVKKMRLSTSVFSSPLCLPHRCAFVLWSGSLVMPIFCGHALEPPTIPHPQQTWLHSNFPLRAARSKLLPRDEAISGKLGANLFHQDVFIISLSFSTFSTRIRLGPLNANHIQWCLHDIKAVALFDASNLLVTQINSFRK